MATRAYDLLVYGATGFTGRLVARYLAQHAPASLKWGLAGRDAAKLERIKAELVGIAPSASRVGIVTGAGPTASDVARATKVVVTTAGPFALHGEPLLAACVAEGTDYLDITGETSWVADMLSKYGEEAKRKGVAIVPMSGFDSVPADLGTFFLLDHVRRTHGLRCTSVTGCMSGTGTVSGGTIASGLNMMRNPEAQRKTKNPTLLCPPPPPSPTALVAAAPDFRAPFWMPEIRKWTAPFVMAAINTRVVRRSACLFATQGAQANAAAEKKGERASLAPLGEGEAACAYSLAPFSYTEYMGSRSFLKTAVITLALGIFQLLTFVPGFLRLAGRLATQPGSGASDEVRAKSRFYYHLVAKTEEVQPRTVVACVSGGDGGYDETAKMLAEAGVLMATKRASLPATRFGGGFLTPATAMGHALVERLNAQGLRFQIERDELQAGGSGSSGSGSSKAK